jgi:Phosphodiester glycosidase
MRRRVLPMLSIAALILFCSQPKSFAQWVVVADGAELLQQQPHDNVTMTYLRVALDRFNIRVATPRVLKFGAANQTPGQNPERSPRGFFLDEYISRYDALAAISASYVKTFSPPTPLGQIKSDGIIVGTPHSSWATEGVFCSDKGRASIEVATGSLADMNYRDCIQVGPILLQDHTVPADLLSSTTGGSDYDKMINGQVGHSIACIDKAGRVLLGLTGRMPLSELVAALKHAPLYCASAIRLQPGGMQVKSNLYGTDSYLHPSALVVAK